MYSDRVQPVTGDELMRRTGVILAAWEKGDVPAEQTHNDLKILFDRAGRLKSKEADPGVIISQACASSRQPWVELPMDNPSLCAGSEFRLVAAAVGDEANG